MPVTPYAGPSGYTPFYLSIYGTYVLRFSMPVYWGCSTNNDLRPLFSGNFSKRHVDIGVGTGGDLDEPTQSQSQRHGQVVVVRRYSLFIKWLVLVQALHGTSTYHQDSHNKRVDSGDTPRNADCSRIYNQLSHVCFIYGSHSWGVKSATSSTTSELVHAEITIIESQSRSHFTLHPATIDAESRLLILSKARGLARNVPELALPTVIEEIEISVGADILDARAWRRFRVVPCAEVYARGNIAFRATGIRFRPLDHDNASSDLLDAHAIARLHWLPHFGFVDTSTLIGSPVVDREELMFTRKIDPMLHYRSIRELNTSSPVGLALSSIETGLANRYQNGGNKKDDPDVSGEIAR
ncbi:hypothetical protein FocTR4_00014872 [Fusarium oxysporum f. sp. cubense]|uniref:Polyketide synthase dehydratase domain-containing protein n=1 Tax=Fusarium oxysporum f. sp. cubense TaxID=61366 RepID=A0A5C6SY37_FUSOC|nr:hypothetical protein FocTR4_00014872 [Fusarium oxysporum f. sp. cubense]